MLNNFFNLFYRSFGTYKWHVVVLAVLSFVSGFFGGIGVNALVPLFSFIVRGEQTSSDIVSQTIGSLFSFLGISFSVSYLLVFIVMLFVLKACVLMVFSYVNGRILADYEARKRRRLFELTVGARWPYLMQQKLGHLTTILMTDVIHTKSLMVLVSSGLLILGNLIVYTFVAINISLYITLTTFILGGILFFSVFRLLFRRVRQISEDDERLTKDVAHYVNERILGMKTIKVMGVADAVAAIGGSHFVAMQNLRIRSALTNTLSSTLLEPFSLIFLSLLFAFSYNTPGFDLAAFLVVLYASKQIFLYIEQLQSLFLGANSIVPYARRVLEYEDEAFAHREMTTHDIPFVFNRELSFDRVRFSYIHERGVLDEVSFCVPFGAMVGLIGPSGAGKTTILDLVLRLFEPTSGIIYVDGRDIRTMGLQSWRSHVGYVAQDVFLLNDTIANNIRFYHSSLSDRDIRDAARMAHIADFIESLPQQYETVVGERGVFLSAGQRQRISIARVLARKPSLLLLDEATSALDNESETKIQEAISQLRGTITIIVVAHRLSTIMNSDSLIVLDDGRIIEQGNPQELLENQNSYFYRMQHLSKN